MMMNAGVAKERTGAALIFVFITLISLTVVVLAFVTMVHYEIRSSAAGLRNMQAFYIAEAGIAKARWALTIGQEPVGWGEEDEPFGEGPYEGTYTVTTVDNGDGTYTIESEGYIPDDNDPIAKRKAVQRNIQVSAGGDGPNLSLTAVASASSAQGGNTANKSNDGLSNTKWKSNISNGSWLKHDFASQIDFDKIVFDGNQIASYQIQYSTDNVAYQPVSNPVESPGGAVSFDSVTARYLKLNVNGNRPEVNELEAYDTGSAPGVSLGLGKFVTFW
ncbi:MAG: discoidin domain-containing protein [Candidatus Omnitrophica bacterium]|nr:discoidin domain-containing protein [Candidatus Omnitrophota bacterium]